MLECVVNISEGRDPDLLAALVDAASGDVLDVHRDGHHHRSVLTLVGEDGPRRLTAAAVERLDLRTHVGVHPRIGVVDVVPFVPLAGSTMADAIAARDRFCAWASDRLDLPCFAYGPERSLPDVRRQAFSTLAPTSGPAAAHPTAGAIAVGARPLLVAYNLWLAEADLDAARAIARELRSPAVRALGLAVGDAVQVSMNLVDPMTVGPGEVWDAVADRVAVARAELVGLVPEAVLHRIRPERWHQLDLAEDKAIEARLSRRGDRS